ncbi:HPr family phosphocarrier protein [Hyphomonas johnsonii]|jgi:phosphocarrier protein|uniref:Phosphocarrier protein HPr n=1 Tax=Hyphomonas johnsonii MHS-2 TaxID=1280950 RepID=A0A059FQJ2_9PROT|nr:HPr family phosphocarrier protein [Hyphomonas johnsonii]KCZ92791.1 phosphocarrier protein HPr [Hyphomonas johnsonii MHS-2]
MSELTGTARQRVVIVNRKGLHARASARLSRLAGEFDAQVTVRHEAESADARSIMDLLMLVAHMGCEVELQAEGPEAAEAVTAIASLIADGFGEQGPADVIC